jgi:hypothetical protein
MGINLDGDQSSIAEQFHRVLSESTSKCGGETRLSFMMATSARIKVP